MKSKQNTTLKGVYSNKRSIVIGAQQSWRISPKKMIVYNDWILTMHGWSVFDKVNMEEIHVDERCGFDPSPALLGRE